MKRILLIIGLFILTISNVNAITIERLGVTIDMPQEYTIMTRENIKEFNLEELNINYYEKMYFYDVNNIYLESISDNDVTIYLRAIKNPGINNYTKDTDFSSEVFKVLKHGKNKTLYNVLNDKQKWMIVVYNDENHNNKQVIDCFLSWNDLFITITFQPKGDTLPKDYRKTVESILKTVKVTGNGKVEAPFVLLDKIDVKPKKDYTKIIVISIICFVAIIVSLVATRKKRA